MGFNNLEQGIILACVIASMLFLMRLAIVFGSAATRTIEIAEYLRRIANALEHKVSMERSNVRRSEEA